MNEDVRDIRDEYGRTVDFVVGGEHGLRDLKYRYFCTEKDICENCSIEKCLFGGIA